jgi:hypothetical protein
MPKQKSLEEEIKAILCQRATDADRDELEALGMKFKNPTKMTLLAVALDEKATKGDLNAMREIFSRLGDAPLGQGEVVLIDDIGNTDK